MKFAQGHQQAIEDRAKQIAANYRNELDYRDDVAPEIMMEAPAALIATAAVLGTDVYTVLNALTISLAIAMDDEVLTRSVARVREELTVNVG